MQESGQNLRQYKLALRALLLASVVSVGYYVAAAIFSHDGAYWYLVWNLFLAWLPLLLSLRLIIILPRHGWNSWPTIIITLLWFVFLPNSFYLISDLIHIGTAGGNILFDSVMFLSFVSTGVMLGFTSLYMVHQQWLKRLTATSAHVLVALVLAACSFAIYLGRDLRWNSWDVLVNPGGILFDISDRLVNPLAHPQAFTTTLAFFVLLGSMYCSVWLIAESLQKQKESRA